MKLRPYGIGVITVILGTLALGLYAGQGLTVLLFSIAGLRYPAGISPSSEKAASSPGTGGIIDRTAGPIRLGMTLVDFQKSVKSQEQAGMNLGLIEDERSFEIDRESHPEEVRSMGCRFLHGRLYRITVEYRDGVFDEARWDALVKKNMERYGKVPIQSQSLRDRPTDFIQWDDSQTRLLLQREHRLGFESKKFVKRYTVLMVILDQALWRERQEAEVPLF